MYKVIEVLDQVAGTSSRNEKLDILKANRESARQSKGDVK